MNKITVVFINPPTPDRRKITRNCDCASESKGNYLLQPFDFLYLSSAIPDHIDFYFIDAVADKLDFKSTINQCLSHEPTHIVTAIVDLCWNNDLEFLKKIRNEIKNAHVFVFGDALVEEYNRIEVLKIADGIIDNAFSFDITKTFEPNFKIKLAENKIDGLSINNKRPFSTKTPIASEFNFFPKHKKFENINYRWPFARHKKYTSIATNWGCPFACTYCIDSIFPFYYRSYQSLKKELIELQSLDIKELVITDKSFGHPRKNTIEILKIMTEFKFSWSTYIHPNQCEEELLNLMKKSGCHTIIIGIESDKEEHLKEYNRTTNKSIVLKAIQNAQKIGIDVCGDFLIGLPQQSIDDIESLMNYSQNLDLDYASFNLVAPLPGSKIKKIAIDEGRMSTSDHHYDSVGNFKILKTNKLNEQDLIRLRKKANFKFYFRLKILFKRLTKIRSFEHLALQLHEGLELFLKRPVRETK